MMKNLRSLTLTLALVAALPAFAQMQPPPAPVGETQLIEVMATVKDVDAANRLLTITGPQGREVLIKAGPEVENLDMVKVGDMVDIAYYRAALQAAEKLDPDAKRMGTETDGEKLVGTIDGLPAAMAARTVRETVEILGVDKFKKAIAFRDRTGRFREVSVDEPRLAHWLDDLQEGDKVAVAYSESLAIRIEPKK